MTGLVFYLFCFLAGGAVGYGLGLKRRSARLLPEAERLCAAIATVRGSTIRCSYDRFHSGPHHARVSSYEQHYWANNEDEALERELRLGRRA